MKSDKLSEMVGFLKIGLFPIFVTDNGPKRTLTACGKLFISRLRRVQMLELLRIRLIPLLGCLNSELYLGDNLSF